MKSNNHYDRNHFPRSSEPRDMSKCFVMMPIKKGFDEVYDHIIKPLLADIGINAVRGDEIFSSNPIIEDIWREIQSAGWIIADLTERNPNVLYELGLAHGINRDVILLTQKINDVPFDLQHWRCIEYSQTIEGGEKLKDNLRHMFIDDSRYLRTPLVNLTERFKDSFNFLECSTNVKLFGTNGSIAMFQEEWRLVPLKPGNIPEFTRKIQTAGLLTDIASEPCEAQMRKFMEGVYLITISPPIAASQNKMLAYRLNYKVSNGFAPGEEFWNFDFDCTVEHFTYTFQFSEECIPAQFQALQRSDEKKSILTHEHYQTNGMHHYIVEAKDIPSGNAINFKWKWT